jgi:hypothetical protein
MHDRLTHVPAELVFDDRQKALQALKQVTGSQLKKFPTREEAEACSKARPREAGVIVIREEGAEKSTVASFKSVPARELAPFRRAIEKGDITHVKELIWSNPRYLISSGDTAVVLMAGPRYNASHVAAKADKNQILQLILQTVSDHKFVRSLYVSDDDETTKSRCRVLLDCYLNTPDQGVRNVLFVFPFVLICFLPILCYLFAGARYSSALCMQIRIRFLRQSSTLVPGVRSNKSQQIRKDSP